jgi:stearoyl-CoA desaturase (delta-9 desaturase)
LPESPDLKDPKKSSKAAEREAIFAAMHPSQLRWDNIDWVVTFWTVVMHAGAIAAPFFFTWSALGVCIFLHWLTCSVGVCLGYHRYLSHKALKLRPPAEFFTMLCGTLSAEGTPLGWAANHRLHHQRSDQPGDPHSPLDGPWWSHILWLFVRTKKDHNERIQRVYVPELLDRPILRFFEKTEIFWHIGSGALLFVLGGWPMLLWGMCMRMVLAYHSTWFVNSATHLWGYRNYETRDHSRNLWWVALVSYGEGWHNNHHAHPSVAPAGHRWWEFDATWQMIKLFRFLGLAYDVKDRIPDRTSRAAGADENELPHEREAAAAVG